MQKKFSPEPLQLPVDDPREYPPGYESETNHEKPNSDSNNDHGVRIIGGDEEAQDNDRAGYSTSV